MSGTYILTTPLLMVVMAIWISRTSGTKNALLFVALHIVSIGFWYNSVTGSDFIAIGFCMAFLWIAVNARQSNLTVLAVLTGLVATSRIIFAFLGPLFAALMWPQDRRASVRFALVSGMTTLVTHAAFYLWNPAEYGPAHVFSKGQRLLSTPLLIGGAILFVVVIVIALYWVYRRKVTLESGLLMLVVVLGPPLLAVSIGDLLRRTDLTSWEGSDYLTILLPICALFLVRQQPHLVPSSYESSEG